MKSDMLDYLGRFLVRMTRTRNRELMFSLGFIALLFAIVGLGQLMGGQAGARAACFVAMVPCALCFAILLNHRIRRERKEALCQTNQEPPTSVPKRFRKHFLNIFASWAGSWISILVAGTILALVNGKANAIRPMINLDGLIGLVGLIALGIPLALLLAAIGCWFKGTDGTQDAVQPTQDVWDKEYNK